MVTNTAQATAPRTIDVLGYQVIVGGGMLDSLGVVCHRSAPSHRYAVISDDQVARHWLEPAVRAIGNAIPRVAISSTTVPAGESSKSRDQWVRLTDWLLAEGAGRDTAIVALGGGVVGDLAGFVAATYLRGVPVIQVPTTLLAMVDAAIGGKTGVDTPRGKNLVGAFHQPAAVVVDPVTLGTLPAAHVRAGIAEVIKHGAIRDAALFELLERDVERVLALEDPELTLAVLDQALIASQEAKKLDERAKSLQDVYTRPATLVRKGAFLGLAEAV